MNGATGTSSTETGAYTLVGGQTSGTAPARNSGATFYIPTEDQWYKAAYYKGGSTNAGYWQYATQSDTNPTAVNATTVGTGTSGGVSPVTSGNFANYARATGWNGIPNGNVTTVGTNGGPSAYEAFDMNGNLWEWNDQDGTASATKGIRGGSFFSFADNLASSGRPSPGGPDLEHVSLTGFRLVAVPEPSTWVMGAVGLAGLAWRSVRRRRAC
jgi:formylglycine-generating enzyme required for sulfatase activity